jgi:hypothetical protein
MSRVLNQIMWGFLALFGLGVIVVIAFQLLYTGPEQRCLAGHGWWDSGQRVCGTPVSLPLFTGKPNKAPPAIGPGAQKRSEQP